jgi:hypothetical protein
MTFTTWHLSTIIIVLNSNSMFPLAIYSSKSFHSNFVPFYTSSEFRLRKHSDLMFYSTYESILIDINVSHLSVNTIYWYFLIPTCPFIICHLHIRMSSSSHSKICLSYISLESFHSAHSKICLTYKLRKLS